MHLPAITINNLKYFITHTLGFLTNKAVVAFTTVCAFIDAFMFQGDYNHVYIILIAIILDTIFWFAVAWKNKDIHSNELFRAASKFIIYMAYMICWHLVDVTLMPTIQYWVSWIMFFLVSTEVITIFEHIWQLWYKPPTWLHAKLRTLQDNYLIKK